MVTFFFLTCGTGVCFPMGKGLYRVVHIPVDECVLLNSRDKAPYLICIEVLRCEAKRFGHFSYCTCVCSTSSSQCYHHILSIWKTSLNNLARGVLLVMRFSLFLGAVA